MSDKLPPDAPPTCQRCYENKIAAKVSTFNLENRWWCKECAEQALADEKKREHEKSYTFSRMHDDVWSLFVTRKPNSSKGPGRLVDVKPASPYNRAIVYRLRSTDGQLNGGQDGSLVPFLVMVNGVEPDAKLVQPFKAMRELEQQLDAKFRFIVAPNGLHHVHLAAYCQQFEDQCKVFVPPGRVERENPALFEYQNVNLMAAPYYRGDALDDESEYESPPEPIAGFSQCGLTLVAMLGVCDVPHPKQRQQLAGTREDVYFIHEGSRSLFVADQIVLWHPGVAVDKDHRKWLKECGAESGRVTFNRCLQAVHHRARFADAVERLLGHRFDMLFVAHSPADAYVKFEAKKLVRKAFMPAMRGEWDELPSGKLAVPEGHTAVGGKKGAAAAAAFPPELVATLERSNSLRDPDEDADAAKKKAADKSVPVPGPVPPARRAEGSELSGVCALQGKRNYMEDRDVRIDDLRAFDPAKADAVARALGAADDASTPLALWCVFDGHSGAHASQYLRDHMAHNIVDALAASAEPLSGEQVVALLKKAFLDTDVALLAQSRAENWVDGSTCVVALRAGAALYVANSGDSEGTLGTLDSDGKVVAIEVTKTFKPTDAEEKARIEAAGGLVLFGRVCGEIAVCRGFGDRTFKVPDNNAKGDLILSEAEVYTVAKLDAAVHRMLVLACDGLWDVCTMQQAAEMAMEQRKMGKSPQQCAEHLADFAFAKESADNITVVVVFL